MKCWTEETFGPIIAVGSFTDEIEAVEIANKGWHGLAAYLYQNFTFKIFQFFSN